MKKDIEDYDDFDILIQIEKWFDSFTDEQQNNILRILVEKNVNRHNIQKVT